MVEGKGRYLRRSDDYSKSRETPIRRFRVALGLSQQKVADLAGLRINVYQRYEHGLVDPRLSVAARIADALGVPIDDLYEREPADG